MDAEKIEFAWRQLPHKSKMLLKFHYIRRMPVTFMCQRLRIKLWNFDATSGRAHYQLRKMLDELEKMVYKASKSELLRESVEA